MKQWFLCGLTSTVCVTGAWAAPRAAGDGDEWAGLDRDIQALSAAALQSGSNGPTASGLIRTAWLDVPNILPQDIKGFELLNAQLSLEGQVNPQWGYRLQLEAAGGAAELLDAYGTWRVNDYLRFTMGNFRAPLLWESQLNDGDLLFLLRTETGELFYSRDLGVMVDGSLERIHWNLSMQNGFDAVAGQQAVCGRVGVDLLGKGPVLHQGAYASNEDPSLSVAGSFYKDSGVANDGSVYSADAQLRIGRFAADGSFTKYGSGSGVTSIFNTHTDSQAWAATASFMLISQLVEAAARYQETDNDKNAHDITYGINYYMNGHAAKLQVNATQVFSDDPTVDRDWRWGIGVAVGV